MINRTVTFYLLTFPVGLMGAVQSIFGLMSLTAIQDGVGLHFLGPGAVMLLMTVIVIALRGRIDTSRLGFRDALFFATTAWVISGLLGAIPIFLITGTSVTNSVFESVSGITTTGATVLAGLDEMPPTFLMYRQFLQWLGGLGVVIFVVAVLPMLNVGGMKLLKAETPGPIKDEKLSPRIANTTHYLLLVYLSLTCLCAVIYYICGMSGFDAVAHAFTTVSTGGFSTYDASLGHFNSYWILLGANIFMLAGAISFALHYKAWHFRTSRLYWSDEETRWFILIVAALSLFIMLVLISNSHYDSALDTLVFSSFHLVSFITSTGFEAANVTEWPSVVMFLLVCAGYLGGCAGSTAGGNKIIRNILCVRLVNLEIKRLIHPKAVFVVKYQGRPLETDVMSATVAYMTASASITLLFTLALITTGLDFWSAFTAVAACINVLGPAFGTLGSNYQPVSDAGKWILTVAMIMGRLEFFTILALLSPSFWRQ